MTDVETIRSSLRAGQPVVGLDFDGVLNIVPMRFDRSLPPGFEIHMVELDRANWPTHPYVRPLPPSPERVLHRITVSRAHGVMVRSWLAEGAAVVWATTWERAVLRNAHLCDIPELPVLEISKVVTHDAPRRTAEWKVLGMRTAFPGHPLVWVDDFGAGNEGEWVYGEPPADLLIVAPDETVGLTQEQSDLVRDFVRRHVGQAATE